jgi:general secretion pathway protein I
MRLHPARRDGLSLLEVLVSLAIFLMALTALTYLVNNSSNLAVEGQHRARAAQLARSKMNEFTSGAQPIQGQSDTSFDDEPDYRWSADVSEGATTGLSTVTVTVTYRPDDPYPLKVSFSRMVFDPKYAGSTQDVPAAPDGSSDSLTDPSSSGSSSSGSGGSSPASGAASGGGSSAAKGSSSAASGSKGASMGSGAGAGAASKGTGVVSPASSGMGSPAASGSKGGTSTGGKGK